MASRTRGRGRTFGVERGGGRFFGSPTTYHRESSGNYEFKHCLFYFLQIILFMTSSNTFSIKYLLPKNFQRN